MECKNCQESITDNNQFCHVCGAKVIRNRLTIRNIWADFCEQFLNYDNRFLKTFFGLIIRPHIVIGAYINGTRKKYVNVISYFAIALTFSGLQIFVMRKFFPEALDLSAIMPNTVPEESMDINWIYDYMSILALLNLPVYGFIARMTFIGLKKFNYTEHLVIMTYILAQFTIMNTLVITPLVAIFGVNFYVVGYLSNFVMMIFTTYAYKKMYPLSLGNTLARVLLFFVVAGVLAVILGILQVGYAIIDAGGFEEYLLEVKKQQEEMKKATSYIISSAINWTS